MSNKKKYNCPNCGAPIGYGSKCEYCGTLLNWIPVIQYKVYRPEVKTFQASISIPIEWQKFMEEEVLEKMIKKRLAEASISAVEECMEIEDRRGYEGDKVFVGRLRLVC